MAFSFPDEVLERVFSFVDSDEDRNSISLVCKDWYRMEKFCRRRIFVRNCYAVSPQIAVRRFPELRSVSLKGKPHRKLVPPDWGGDVRPWVEAMAEACPHLEELRLKRMVVGDESLELLSHAFTNFKVLVLFSCEAFSTDGLGAIAANCRNLRVLDLQDSVVDYRNGHWLSYFPDSCTSLEFLNLSCLEGALNFSVLERLVGRCPNLRTLRLNDSVSLDELVKLLLQAPQLVDLGTGGFSALPCEELCSKFASALQSCRGLRSLSGFWFVSTMYLRAIYSVCAGLTSLDLRNSTMHGGVLVKLVSECRNLQRLLVLDYIEDAGLNAVAESCKELREIRVLPSDPYGAVPPVALTYMGLIAISAGCPRLQSIFYFCRQMTNTALTLVAMSRPNLTCFRLCIMEPRAPDYFTQEPLDEGFGAIVRWCKDLRRLSVSGLLTNRVFEYIGANAKQLEMLSVAFAGESDLGLHYVLSGCNSLRKLEIRNCPFSDKALLANAAKLETIRSIWMSECSVSFGACKLLGQKLPWLNIAVIDEAGQPAKKLYIYRTVTGPRSDMPNCVRTM